MIHKSEKIAIASDSFPPHRGSGIASAHYNLYRILKKQTYVVKVFTFGNYNEKLESEENIFRYGTPPYVRKILRFFSTYLFKILDGDKIAYQTADILASSVGSLLQVDVQLDT